MASPVKAGDRPGCVDELAGEGAVRDVRRERADVLAIAHAVKDSRALS